MEVTSTSAVNWENWKRVLDVIRSRPDEAIRMQDWIFMTDRYDGLVNIQEKLHNCGTAGCIAGWTVLALTSESTVSYTSIEPIASKLLGLNGKAEVDWVFLGEWSTELDEIGGELCSLRKEHVVAYMEKALAERNLMVSL